MEGMASMQEGMSRCFQSTLLPRFEAAVKEMFAQLDSTVSSGVKHHLEVISVLGAVAPADWA